MNKVHKVSLLRRFAAILYDLLLVVAILLIASLPWVMLGVKPGQPSYVFYVIFIYSLIIFYFAWFWTHGGQTLGMKAWHIRVVSTTYQTIGWRAALLRAIFSFVSFALLGIGFWHAWFDARGRCWHDIVSRSQLINVPSVANKNPALKKTH